MDGLKISNPTINGSTVSFIIDEIEADTIASFYMDAYVGDWVADGSIDNVAILEHVPDFESGGLHTLTSNTVNTAISAIAEVGIEDTIIVLSGATTVSLDATIDGDPMIKWTSAGDGSFDSNNTASTNYTFGSEDINNKEVSLFISLATDCGENGKTVHVIFADCTLIVEKQIGECDDNGTNTNPVDDIYAVSFHVIETGTGDTNNYNVTDGTNTYGPYSYDSDQEIILPADGNIYTLVFTDVDNSDCKIETTVMQNSCSIDTVVSDCDIIESAAIACGHNAYYCVLNKEYGGLKYYYEGHLSIPQDYQLCDVSNLEAEFDAGEIDIIDFRIHQHQGVKYISYDCFLYIHDEEAYEEGTSLITFDMCSNETLEADYCFSYVLPYQTCWTDYNCVFKNGGVTANNHDYVDVNYCIYLHESVQANCTVSSFELEAVIYGDDDSKTIFTTTIDGDFNKANCIKIPISVDDFMSGDYNCVEFYITGDCPDISCVHLDCNVFYNPSYSNAGETIDLNAYQIVALQPIVQPAELSKNISRELTHSDIKMDVFPIPTINMLNIEIAGIDIAKTQLVIKNILGQVVQKIEVEEINMVLDLSTVNNGVYYIAIVKDGKNLVTKKVVKI